MQADKRILWLCRRGTKELDLMFERFIKDGYAQLNEAERGVFERILAVEDDVLQAWMFGQGGSDDPEVRALFERIRGF